MLGAFYVEEVVDGQWFFGGRAGGFGVPFFQRLGGPFPSAEIAEERMDEYKLGKRAAPVVVMTEEGGGQ